jgi:hypothetical protein
MNECTSSVVRGRAAASSQQQQVVPQGCEDWGRYLLTERDGHKEIAVRCIPPFNLTCSAASASASVVLSLSCPAAGRLRQVQERGLGEPGGRLGRSWGSPPPGAGAGAGARKIVEWFACPPCQCQNYARATYLALPHAPYRIADLQRLGGGVCQHS